MRPSSDDVINALTRNGFLQSAGTGRKGTHRTYYRKRQGNVSQTVTVILGKREMPKGTLRNMARQLGITIDELMDWLK